MNTKYIAILLSGAAPHWGAFAHEGHGLESNTHWHATDALGFVGMLVIAAAAWYFSGRK